MEEGKLCYDVGEADQTSAGRQIGTGSAKGTDMKKIFEVKLFPDEAANLTGKRVCLMIYGKVLAAGKVVRVRKNKAKGTATLTLV